jgi:hypothetical protein
MEIIGVPPGELPDDGDDEISLEGAFGESVMNKP